MFFGDAFAGSFFNLFATHPPLERRIRALEPQFNGRFPEVLPVAITAEGCGAAVSRFRPLQAVQTPAPQAAPQMAVNAAMMVQQIGQPQTEHLEQAGQTMVRCRNRCWTPPGNRSVPRRSFMRLLLSRDDEATQAKQWQLLQGKIEPPLYKETQQLAAAALKLPPAARLPVVDLTIPAFKRSSPQQYATFRQMVECPGAGRRQS